jgi:hypothetical protein
MGVSAPGGQMNPVMGGIPQGAPNAHAMSHLNPQAQLFQAQHLNPMACKSLSPSFLLPLLPGHGNTDLSLDAQNNPALQQMQQQQRLQQLQQQQQQHAQRAMMAQYNMGGLPAGMMPNMAQMNPAAQQQHAAAQAHMAAFRRQQMQQAQQHNPHQVSYIWSGKCQTNFMLNLYQADDGRATGSAPAAADCCEQPISTARWQYQSP